MKVLVITTQQIGDVLLTTPLIHAVRERWPAAQVDVLGFGGTLGVLEGNADIDARIETPRRLGREGFVRLLRSLWRRYDLALVTEPGDRPHLIGWIAARHRSGIVRPGSSSNWWKKLLLDRVVVGAGDAGGVHVVAEKLSLLSPDAANETPARAEVVTPARRALPDDVQARLRPGCVVLHVPSLRTYKQWPLEHYRAVAGALLAAGHQVVLTGSSAARDRELVGSLLDLAPAPDLLDVAGRLDFSQVAALVAQAALYIGPDTSVTHLAAACGTPTIAIFGPTNPQRWSPWPARPGARALFQRSALVQTAGNVTLLQGGLACVPCARAGCEDRLESRSDCLPAITPARVLEQARRVLGEAARSRGSSRATREAEAGRSVAAPGLPEQPASALPSHRSAGFHSG
jgi:heptosyltransferase-3